MHAKQIRSVARNQRWLMYIGHHLQNGATDDVGDGRRAGVGSNSGTWYSGGAAAGVKGHAAASTDASVVFQSFAAQAFLARSVPVMDYDGIVTFFASCPDRLIWHGSLKRITNHG
jgi:hypothetical protein